MKNKTVPWTKEEEQTLINAVRDKISPLRLSVRLQRSEASIKRRMRELGLIGKRRNAAGHAASEDRVTAQPAMLVDRWLETCRSGDLRALTNFYAEEATLECACSGSAVYAGLSAIQEYWAPKLLSAAPNKFTLNELQVEGERIRVDYFSYEAKPVRMYLSLDDAGKIIAAACGPRACDRRAA